jgi:threonine dehydrogenase-like Zn-dependent dehydrogenase
MAQLIEAGDAFRYEAASDALAAAEKISRLAQTPVQHYLPKLLERIENGDIDPSFVITHTAPLEKGPELYKTFRDKKDGCIKVVLKPGMKEPAHA